MPRRATQRFAPGEKVPASWKVEGKQDGIVGPGIPLIEYFELFL